MKLPKLLRLPTVVELGFSKSNFLPSRRFDPFEKGYCWEDYNKYVKNNYPIRYFLNDTFSLWFSVKIKRPISNFFYWISSFLIKKDHLLDLRQPEKTGNFYRWGYLNPCDKILFGCFNALVDYIEKGQPQNPSKWIKEETNDMEKEMLKQQYEEYKEAKTLYYYWVTNRKYKMDNYMRLYKNMKNAHKEEEYRKLKKIWLDSGAKFEQEEQEMLQRLIKIRRGLWT